MNQARGRSVPRLKVLVLYEYGADLRPHSSAFLRLVRPFTHPLVEEHLDIILARDYNNEPVDVVIIDRLWHKNITLQLAQELVNRIRLKGARVVYSLDDNYFDLAFDQNLALSREVLPIVTFWLRQADAVMVTTPDLRKRLLEYNPNIYILPNQLDERLLVIQPLAHSHQTENTKSIVIGYMGTFTHDEDLRLILPALRSIHQRHPESIEVQIIGVVDREETKKELQSLPVRYVYPRLEEHEYPLFMLWFTGHVHWDIAISPLQNTPFNNCKSDIKFLDYAAIGAAGIYSHSPAYTSTVHHQQNGWLAENTPGAWEEALETLIQDETFRLGITRNASRYLYSERLLAHRALDWVELVKSFC